MYKIGQSAAKHLRRNFRINDYLVDAGLFIFELRKDKSSSTILYWSRKLLSSYKLNNWIKWLEKSLKN